MSIFYRKTEARVPEECKGLPVVCQRSACTGERTVGFYDRKTDRLLCAELVRGEEDIGEFCKRYGIAREDVKKG